MTIRDLTVRVRPQNKNAHLLCILLLALAAAGFATSFTVPLYRGIIQLFSALFIVAALTVYSRYLGAKYSYEIFTNDGEGEPLFIVRQTTGKRISILCRVTLAGISEVVPLSMKEAKARAVASGVHRYLYTTTLCPSRVFYVKVRTRHEKADLILEGSDEFFSYLSASAKEAALYYPPFAEEEE